MAKPSEFDAFSSLVSRVLSVPKTEILRREAEYKKESRAIPNRQGRGRKKKINPSASPAPNAV
jgi:hypothetical protein